MKINWKHLATTIGYKSLKACVIYDITHNRRSKIEAYFLFHKVIGMAISAIEKQDLRHITKSHAVAVVLNAWEDKRTYWWVSFYSSFNFKELEKGNSIKPIGVKGIRSYYKNNKLSVQTNRTSEQISSYQKELRKKSGKKARWNNPRKLRQKHLRNIKEKKICK